MKKHIHFCCLLSLTALATMLLMACSGGSVGQKTSAADPETFIKEAEKSYLSASIKDSPASWVQSNFITDDTETIAADSQNKPIGGNEARTGQSSPIHREPLS